MQFRSIPIYTGLSSCQLYDLLAIIILVIIDNCTVLKIFSIFVNVIIYQLYTYIILIGGHKRSFTVKKCKQTANWYLFFN